MENTTERKPGTYYLNGVCIGCLQCFFACPQKCIDISNIPIVIDESRCIQCGQCAKVCKVQAIIQA